MADNKEKLDKFALLASGGKNMNGVVKRMDEIQPLEFEHFCLEETKKQEIIIPSKSEKEEYENFLLEKSALKKKFEKFLKNYSTPVEKEPKRMSPKSFDYRRETEEDKKNFYGVLSGKGEWERIKLPHYVGPDGRWNAFYRTIIRIEKLEKNKRYVIDFEAVDYEAEVYINGRLCKNHTGFFAPFRADITDYVFEGDNVLLIVVKNDITTTGNRIDGMDHYGNKIYGATHLGYDEPILGWHHCPAGAGIFGKVELCVCENQNITDIFVRPDIDNGKIQVNTTVFNFKYGRADCKIKYKIEGRNFNGKVFETGIEYCDPMQIDENYFQKEITLDNFKLWTLDEPYLYEITVSLYDERGVLIDEKQTHFGMRKFAMDENSTPKGAFYFNNERIMLRGTNEMGHLPRCIMEGDYDKLIDDILTAKIANLNFYRMTQRPVFDEIYTYFDMLGMLCQSDFPLFSYLKESALYYALPQVIEMEKLTRNHPSVILETFCNETLDKTAWYKEQYNLSRYEIEKFFDASKKIVEIENPDRVIKYCEGDYAPLEKTDGGISDFHCYTYWYVSHGMPSGKLRKGYLPPIRKDYMTGCGEFGVVGLDRFELMKKYCPKEWLPETENDIWTPKDIAKEQCYMLHGNFFPEQETAKDWIRESRKWQKTAIKDYVDLLRFRSDYIESTAVHLLIDAWPCGWTKTLVDVDRVPKPAFYAFKEANEPVRVYLRRDKYVIYSGERASVELYVYNDKPTEEEYVATVSVYCDGVLKKSYKKTGKANPVLTTYCGDIVEDTSNFVGKITVLAEMLANGKTTYDSVEFTVKSPMVKAKKTPVILGSLDCIKEVCSGKTDDKTLFTDGNYYVQHKSDLEEKILSGARVVLFIDKPITVFDETLNFRVHTLEEEVQANNFVARSESSVFTKEFEETAFMNFYNAKKDYQDLTAWFKFDWQDSEDVLFSFEFSSDKKYALHKKHKLITARKKYGKGELIISTLSALDGCIGHNPVLDKFIINLIEK